MGKKHISQIGALREIKRDYSDVIFLPIPHDEPILIFIESKASVDVNMTDEEYENYKKWVSKHNRISLNAGTKFISYWRGHFYNCDFPDIIRKFYKDNFYKFTKYNFAYDLGKFPKKGFKLDISSLFNSGIFDISNNQFKLLKYYLRKCGLLKEHRGKYKKITQEKKNRDRRIIQIYKDIIKITKRKKPLPINNIYRRLDDFHASFATIRRVLKKAGY